MDTKSRMIIEVATKPSDQQDIFALSFVRVRVFAIMVDVDMENLHHVCISIWMLVCLVCLV